jgi:TP901 family phage tail tape measure protein
MSGAYDAAGRSAEDSAAKQRGAATSVGSASKKSAEETAAATEKSNKSLTRFGNWGTAAVVGFAAGAVDLGLKFEQSTTKIAKSADISTEKANKIGQAMLATAGQTEFSAKEQADAYGQVAGQLGLVEGHALTVAQAMEVDRAAMVLAEASGIDLGSAMSSTAKIMQAYQVDAAHASDVTTILENTARVTGNSIGGVAMVLQRMKTQLGVLAPPISQTSALLVDLAAHGETGRGAIGALNAAMTKLTSPLTGVAVAQDHANQVAKTLPPTLQALAGQLKESSAAAAGYQAQIKQLPIAEQNAIAAFNAAQGKTGASATAAVAALPPALEGLAKGYAKATAQTGQYQAQIKALPADQQALMKSFTDAQSKIDSARATLAELPITLMDAKGNFVGLQSVIAQLQPQLKGLSESQALAKLQEVFGAGASRKLLEVVQAGPAAFAKYEKGVTNQRAAEAAAEKQSKTLEAQMKMARATFEDLGVKLGTVLIPKFEVLAHDLETGVAWLEKHKSAAQALALVIGGVLAAAVAVFTEQKLVKMAKGLKGIYDDFGKVTSAIGSAITKINEWGSANDKATTKVEAQGKATQAAGVETQAAGAAGVAGARGPAGVAGAAGAAGDVGASALTEAATTAGLTLEEAATTVAGTLTEAATTMAATITGAATTDASTSSTAVESDTATESSAVESDAATFSSAVDEAGATFAEEVGGAGLVSGGRGGGLTTLEKKATTAGETAGGAAIGAKALKEAQVAEKALPDLRAAEPGLLEAGTAEGGGLLGAGGVLGTGLSAGGAAVGAVAAPLAGLMAYQQATSFLKSNQFGVGHAVTGAATGVANFFGVGPQQAGQAAYKADLGPASIAALEAVALGFKTMQGTTSGQARNILNQAGVSNEQIQAHREAAARTVVPSTKASDIAANNLKIAADKQMAGVLALQVAAAEQHGGSATAAKAAEAQLKANIQQLTGSNILLYASGQSQSAANTHQTAAKTHEKASDKHLNAAQMQERANTAHAKAAADTSKASNDMKNAANALVTGNTKAATTWETKAEKLDSAAGDMEKAAQMWQSGALLALSQKGPAYPGEYQVMNVPGSRPGPPTSMSAVPHHQAGGVAYGPSMGVFGERGAEALLPLTNPSAMSDIATAIASAGAGGMGSSTTIYQIEHLEVVANNPAEMQAKLTAQARVNALSGRPSGAHNLAVAT